ncbi:MAG: efflux RND transporter periplasmic adaptor subunit [Ignavibacteria bacterium]|jgi:RND family efflux transporter MFP subunit
MNFPDRLQKVKTKRSYQIIVFLLALVLLYFFIGTFSADYSSIPLYRVKQDNFLISVTVSGELRAKRSIQINAPRIRGELKIIHLVQEGTFVERGDTLVIFDPTEELATLSDAESEIEIAKSELKKLTVDHESEIEKMKMQLRVAEISLELSELKLDQMKYEAEAKQQEQMLQHEQNKIDFEKTKKEYENLIETNKTELSKKLLEIEQAESKVDKARNDLEGLVIKAPSSGLVVYSPNFQNQGRKYSVGDTPWSRAQIMELPDLSEMESIVNVNEIDISKVQRNQKVKVSLDAYRDTVFNGVVTNVGAIGKKSSSDASINFFEVSVLISESSDLLKPGMTTINTIIVNEIPMTVYVPFETLFNEKNKYYVYVKNGDGFDKRFVEIGGRNDDYAEILTGLSKDEIVALRDPYREITIDGNEQTDKIN